MALRLAHIAGYKTKLLEKGVAIAPFSSKALAKAKLEPEYQVGNAIFRVFFSTCQVRVRIVASKRVAMCCSGGAKHSCLLATK